MVGLSYIIHYVKALHRFIRCNKVGIIKFVNIRSFFLKVRPAVISDTAIRLRSDLCHCVLQIKRRIGKTLLFSIDPTFM